MSKAVLLVNQDGICNVKRDVLMNFSMGGLTLIPKFVKSIFVCAIISTTIFGMIRK